MNKLKLKLDKKKKHIETLSKFDKFITTLFLTSISPKLKEIYQINSKID